MDNSKIQFFVSNYGFLSWKNDEHESSWVTVIAPNRFLHAHWTLKKVVETHSKNNFLQPGDFHSGIIPALLTTTSTTTTWTDQQNKHEAIENDFQSKEIIYLYLLLVSCLYLGPISMTFL
jgi:hypothetical protein